MKEMRFVYVCVMVGDSLLIVILFYLIVRGVWSYLPPDYDL